MNRKRIRLRYYDYRQTGVYFVTICTDRQRPTFGSIRDGDISLSPLGKLVVTRWVAIPVHARAVSLDLFVVMPNHIHGLLVVDGPGIHNESKRRPGELRGGSLGAVVGGFKASVTRLGRDQRIVGTEPVWQRGFWEHIVRDPEGLARIRRYIAENPSRWHCDPEYRHRSETDPFHRWIHDQ